MEYTRSSVRDDGVTPTPVISRAILVHNRGSTDHLADGIVITPSHNPPTDGDSSTTCSTVAPPTPTDQMDRRGTTSICYATTPACQSHSIQFRGQGDHDTRKISFRSMSTICGMSSTWKRSEVLTSSSEWTSCGASVHYWQPINDAYGLNIEVVNAKIDPTFRSLMPVDHDGQIRMDCSSPYAMAGLIGLKERFQVACANDPDADRHGIVTPSVGLMNPNHYLAVAIHYLLTNRPGWPGDAVVGKTLVSSGLIDRVVTKLGRKLWEVPVGFKWFTPGLFDGACCFGGGESAGASFLRRDGMVWTTDKDGLLLALLAAEITGRTGKDPGVHYRELTADLGTPYYTRIDAPATLRARPDRKLSLNDVRESTLAGDLIASKLTRARK